MDVMLTFLINRPIRVLIAITCCAGLSGCSQTAPTTESIHDIGENGSAALTKSVQAIGEYKGYTLSQPEDLLMATSQYTAANGSIMTAYLYLADNRGSDDLCLGGFVLPRGSTRPARSDLPCVRSRKQISKSRVKSVEFRVSPTGGWLLLHYDDQDAGEIVLSSADFGRNEWNYNGQNRVVSGLISEFRSLNEINRENGSSVSPAPFTATLFPTFDSIENALDRTQRNYVDHYSRPYTMNSLVNLASGDKHWGRHYRSLSEELLVYVYKTVNNQIPHFIVERLLGASGEWSEINSRFDAEIAWAKTANQTCQQTSNNVDGVIEYRNCLKRPLLQTRQGQTVFSLAKSYRLLFDKFPEKASTKTLKEIVRLASEGFLNRRFDDGSLCVVAKQGLGIWNSRLEEDVWVLGALGSLRSLPPGTLAGITTDASLKSDFEQCFDKTFTVSNDPTQDWNLLVRNGKAALGNHAFFPNPDYAFCSAAGNSLRVMDALHHLQRSTASDAATKADAKRDMNRLSLVLRQLWAHAKTHIGMTNDGGIKYLNQGDYLFFPWHRNGSEAFHQSNFLNRPTMNEFLAGGTDPMSQELSWGPRIVGVSDWGGSARWCTTAFLSTQIARRAQGRIDTDHFQHIVQMNDTLQKDANLVGVEGWRSSDYQSQSIDRALALQRAHRDILALQAIKNGLTP